MKPFFSFSKIILVFFSLTFQSVYCQSSELSHEQISSAIGQKDVAICWTNAAEQSEFKRVSAQLQTVVSIQERGLCFLLEANAFNTLENNKKLSVRNLIRELPINQIVVSDGFNTKDAVLRQTGKSNAVGEKMKTEAAKEGLIK
jgi:hypothetical protein